MNLKITSIMILTLLSVSPCFASADSADMTKYCQSYGNENYPSFDACMNQEFGSTQLKSSSKKAKATLSALGAILQGAGRGVSRPTFVQRQSPTYTCSRLGVWINCTPQ